MKNQIDTLIIRLTELPRPEIEQAARVYEARANGTPNARNNVSAKIAIALRLHLENSKQGKDCLLTLESQADKIKRQ
jgi:hypothetical protein